MLCFLLAGDLFIVGPSDFFGAGWRQVIFAGDDILAGFGFEFQAGAFGDFAAGFGGGLVFGQAGGGGLPKKCS